MNKKDITIIAILALLGTVTRFSVIDVYSLWMDEGATYYCTICDFNEYFTEPNSPAYYLIEKMNLMIFGHSEFALRFLSALAGIGMIIMSYIVVQKIFNDYTLSIIVASLVLISPACLSCSVEARGFALIGFLFLCQLYVMLLAMETNEKRYWIYLGLISTLSLAMQFVSLLGTILIFLYVILINKKNKANFYSKMIEIKKNIIVSILTFIISSIPLWYFAIYAMVSRAGADSWPGGIDFVYNTITSFLFNNVYVTVPLLILLIIGAFSCYKSEKEKFYMISFFSIVPFLILTILSLKA